MVFTSYIFLFLFLPICFLSLALFPKKNRHLVLLISSIVFYGYWRLDFVLLIVASTLLDFYCGQKIYDSPSEKDRKKFLIISIVFNLGLLSYFKYFNFGLENLNHILSFLGASTISYMNIVLPVGISFFTFQTMSYSIDIYRREVEPTRDILKFGTYVSMFPQLVAGPIVRYSEIKEQLKDFHSNTNIREGLALFALGFNKKVLIANNVASISDFAFKIGGGDQYTALIGALAYTLQIYFDFSGYSDMAIGLGKMFGFDFPINFNSPYRSKSITEFWNRWHISLSRWFRDYLYIPLGGNRGSHAKTYRNLFLVMFLCGLWHGAAWTFIIWGLYHSAFLILERLNKRRALGYYMLPKPFQIFFTFCIAVIGWIPFRAESVPQLLDYLSAFLNFVPDLKRSQVFEVLDFEKQMFIWLGIILSVGFKNIYEQTKTKKELLYILNLLVFIFAVHELMEQSYNPFLYFNF
jgi:alginate O-acetyltransferase complex protein AlgI